MICENFRDIQTISFAKMAAKDGSFIMDLGGHGLGQDDGNDGVDNDEEVQSSSISVEEKLFQQSGEVHEEWNDCLDHLGKMGECGI